MNNITRKEKTRCLAESAVMIAAATVLSLISFNMPFGGSVTLMGAVPVILISYRHGVNRGIKTGLVFGVIEMIFGLENFSYVSGITSYIILALTDYIVAFSCLGIGGAFKNKFKNQVFAVTLGTAVSFTLKFFCHFLSGVIIWKAYAGDLPVWKYSLVYNISYIIPELLITVVGATAFITVFDITGENIAVKSRKK